MSTDLRVFFYFFEVCNKALLLRDQKHLFSFTHLVHAFQELIPFHQIFLEPVYISLANMSLGYRLD